MPSRHVSGRPLHEVELGPPVVEHLEGEGFEVYQEVNVWAGVADLVGVRGPLLVVVELKVSLSFALLWQARRWRGVAHQVWIAVPQAKPSDGRRMAHTVFADNGIGVLEVTGRGKYGAVTEHARAAFNRRAEADRVRRELRPEHKTFAKAGSSGGAHWTTFKHTAALVRRFVEEHPGSTIREVVEHVKHHYASDRGARARLVMLAERGAVAGVEVRREGRARKLYPAQEPKPA